MILGNLYRQKGQVGAGDHGAPDAAAAHQPDAAGARVRPALPGARFPPWRVRRSRPRSVPGGRPARSGESLRIGQPPETARGSAAVGGRRARAGADCAHRRPAPCARISKSWDSSATSSAPKPRAAATRWRPPRCFAKRSTSIQRRRRRISTSATCTSSAATFPRPIAAWEGLVQTIPERAYLAFERLERAYKASGAPQRFVALCEQLIARNPQDWRARLALSRHYAAAGNARDAFDLLLVVAAPQPARPGRSPGDLASAARAGPERRPRPTLRRADARRGVLPRPARLHALPVPKHRTAVAVPAVPRVEYICRGTNCTGEGNDGRGELA